MKGLSKRQRELLDFIENYVATHRFSPSYHDIMTHFSFSSPGTVYKHLQTLRRKGVVVNEPGKARSCLPKRLAKEKNEGVTEIPLLGSLRLNFPVEIHQFQKNISVASSLLQEAETAYAFSLVGNEWSDEFLCAGDLLLIDPTAPAEDNDTIIATTSNGGVLLRSLKTLDEYQQLTSRNPNLQPLIVRPNDLDIMGIALAVIRQF